MNRLGLFFADMWRSRAAYLFLAPFLLSFLYFILFPVVMAVFLSVTSYDGFTFPRFVGLRNFIALFTQDLVFIQHALPNTFRFALIVGPGGYVLTFLVAWLIHQIPSRIRDWFTLAFYAPAMAGPVALNVVWMVAFSGDRVGYVNDALIRLGIIRTPQLWLQDPKYLLMILIAVSIWMSFGVGFLAMLAGLQTVNPELYEAGRIDGIRGRLQEVFYITVPSMKPQMLFSAVMAIVGTLRAGQLSVQLTGQLITPQYSAHLIINHVDDFAYARYELGYASAVSVVLLLISYGMMRLSYRLFAPKEE
ncbi:carbohydrate ABC transporter permease [Paenibacillus sp. GCM10027626]|uniref:carbohydrate ABC transporter permease n=1 Tax=Paenibacillus sp. GCM10027626 TaxID=3273411 RepID=UPI00362A4CD9